jgi:hypothetical protein
MYFEYCNRKLYCASFKTIRFSGLCKFLFQKCGRKKKIVAEVGDALLGAMSIKYFHSRKIISADKRCVMH